MQITNIKNYKNGWFIGNFIPTLHKSEYFEVGVHEYKKDYLGPRHYHAESTEVNYIVDGKIFVDGVTLSNGDIFVYDPGDVSDVKFLKDTTLVIVKYPSAPGDKHEVA